MVMHSGLSVALRVLCAIDLTDFGYTQPTKQHIVEMN